MGSRRTLLVGTLLMVLLGWLAEAQMVPVSDPPPPVVLVRVRAPAELPADSPATYRITVENPSRSAAHHVLLKVTMPANATLNKATPLAETEPPQLLWKFGTLQPGQKREVTLLLKPTNNDEVELCARVQFEHGQCVRSKIARAGLDIQRIGPAFVRFAEVVSFTLEVRNTGRVTARNVTLEEVLPEAIDYANSTPPISGKPPYVWKLGDLAPGQRKTIRYEAFAKQQGEFKLRSVLKADGTSLERTTLLTVGQSPLALVLTGPCQAIVGRAARYDITVHNHGSVALRQVTLTHELPREIELVSAALGRLDGNTVRWDLGTLEPGSSRRVSLEVLTREQGDYKQVIDGRAEGGLLEQGRLLTRFRKVHEVSLEIVPEKTLAYAGRETLVQVKLTNESLARPEKLSLSIQLPEGVEIIEARGPGESKIEKGLVRFPAIHDLGRGDFASISLRLRPSKAGLFSLKAVVQRSEGVEAGQPQTITSCERDLEVVAARK